MPNPHHHHHHRYHHSPTPTSTTTTTSASSSSSRQHQQPQSIPPSQLGLRTAEDIALFRRHQNAALAAASSTSSSSRNNGPAAAGGRYGSNAALQAAQQGRVLVDAGSLQLLANHFDAVMSSIQRRADVLHRETQTSVQRQVSRTNSSVQAADLEIARMHAVLRQIDDLETEFDKIRQIRDIVGSFRGRVEALERRMG